MASKKNRETRAEREAREQAEQAAEAARRRLVASVVGVVVAVVLLGGGVWFLSSSSDDPAPVANASTTPKALDSAPPTKSADDVKCVEPGQLQTIAKQYPKGPTGPSIANLSPGSTVGLKVTTNCGDLGIKLDTSAVRNVDSLVFLANTGAPICEPKGADCSGPNAKGKVTQRQGYFDNTECHRLTTAGIFVLQCGDPTATGTGEPGYATPDENLDALVEQLEAGDNQQVIYPRGTVAMANSGPDTNGSQFFIVYGDSPLPPAYTIVGSVESGLEIIDAVAKAGVAGGGSDGKPVQTLEFKKVLSFERTQVQQ